MNISSHLMKQPTMRQLVNSKLGTDKANPGNFRYEKIRSSLPLHKQPPAKYDTRFRTELILNATRQFYTAFKERIQRNMRKRLLFYFTRLSINHQTLTKAQARHSLEKLLSHPFQYDDELEVSFEVLDESPFTYVPFLYGLQYSLTEAGVKSFSVVPRNK